MSYRFVPVFFCCLCGKSEFAPRWDDMSVGLRLLPYGWTGSRRKHGECYCENCTRAIERIKKAGEGRTNDH